jgi:hypothetical protein
MDKRDLRERNLEILRAALKSLRCATKPQLAEVSKLSVVTVNTLLQELLAAGEVAVDTEAPSSGGRPAQQYCFNAEYRLALAVYMHEKNNKDTVFISVENMIGGTLERAELQPEKVTLDFFAKVLQPYFVRYPQITVVIVGLPGVEVGGKLAVIDYPELRGKPFCAWLAKKVKRPVYFENDINAAVAGYGYALGSRSQTETIIGIYFPHNYPPGAGIFMQGRIYRGRDGMAGEIGYHFSRQEQDALALVAQNVLLFARTLNPHRMVIYHAGMQPQQAAVVTELCGRELAAEFLPELEIKPDIYEDYSRGIRRLAVEYLSK